MRMTTVLTRGMVVTAAALLLAAAAGGCTSGSSSPSDESPPSDSGQPHYTHIPDDLCEQVAFDRAAEQVGLAVAPWHDPGDNDDPSARTHEYVSCIISVVSEDGRFAHPGRFSPGGVASVEVYHDVAGAREQYDRRTDSHASVLEKRADDPTTAPVSGWWDRGMAFVGIEPLDDPSIPRDPGDPVAPTTRIEITYIVYHQNLFTTVPISAIVPTEDVDAALDVLHELTRAYADELVDPLRPPD